MPLQLGARRGPYEIQAALFHRKGNKMMAVDFTGQPTFSAGKPTLLFEGPYVPTPRSFPDYDGLAGRPALSDAQGRRASAGAHANQCRAELASRARSARKSMNIGTVVRPWFELLKRCVPAK